MIAIPSLAMDYYNYFFARHDLTFFCQIRIVKAVMGCVYQEELPTVIYKAFGIGGNFNASLFLDGEGIASVGAVLCSADGAHLWAYLRSRPPHFPPCTPRRARA